MTWQLVCLLFVTCRRLLGKSREPPLWGGKQLLGKKTTLTCILHTGSDIFTPLQSQLWLRTDFYIWLATVVGCICPWPGNRPKVARSAEKDAVWWIGFSWCSDSENPPPTPQKCRIFGCSHATGLDLTLLCQLEVLTAILLLRQNNTLGLLRFGAEVWTCFWWFMFVCKFPADSVYSKFELLHALSFISHLFCL